MNYKLLSIVLSSVVVVGSVHAMKKSLPLVERRNDGQIGGKLKGFC